jgi:threonine dehydrogenase-like Zn-dependent dehydrogenase
MSLNKLSQYREIPQDFTIPSKMKALVFRKCGLENLRIEEILTPKCGANQVLGRVDAAVACASDLKLISQGSKHPHMQGWDISKNPVVLGHEGAITLVEVGKNLKNKYKVGQTYAIQPAISRGPIHNRKNYRNNGKGIDKVAMGYTISGVFAEYVLIPEEMIYTDSLIPYNQNRIPYFAVSIAEPLACVVCSQEKVAHILKNSLSASRRAVIGAKKGGVSLVMGAGPMGFMHIELLLRYKPSKIIISEPVKERLNKVKKSLGERAKSADIKMIYISPDKLERTINKATYGRGVDDIVVALGIGKIQEKSLDYLARGGVSNFFGGTKKGEEIIKVDARRIHYDNISCVGSSGSEPCDVSSVLKMYEKGVVDYRNYVSCVGSLDFAPQLLKMLSEQKLEGKGVVYPHIKPAALKKVDRWDRIKEDNFLKIFLVP